MGGTGRPQLDGQGKPIELLADERDVVGVLPGQPEWRKHRLRPVHKQAHGIGICRARQSIRATSRRQRQRGNRHHVFAHQIQPHPARYQHRQVRTPAQQVTHHRRPGQQVFKIVQHQQQAATLQARQEDLHHRTVRHRLQPQPPQDGDWQERRIVHLRQ